MRYLSDLRCLAGSVTLTVLAWSLPALAEQRIALSDAFEQLQRDGYPIVFSSDVVRADMMLEIDAVTFENVRAALSRWRLELVQVDGLWLVHPQQPPQEVQIRLESNAGRPIPTSEFSSAGSDALLTAVDGVFVVAATPGMSVWITADGHHPREVLIVSPRQTVQLDAILPVETVIVTGSRHQMPPRSVTGSSTTLMAGEMTQIPALGGDSIRVANRLPGMSSVGVSAKPRVRGGLQNETLIMVDGVELIEAFHLADFQSVFSSIDDRTVESMDIYTGGFPARYGNRMSGVMDITTLDEQADPGTEVGLSLYTVFANTRGQSDDQDTHWLGSIRRGNLDLMIDRINSRTGEPKYFDSYVRVGHRFDADTEWFLGAFISKDDVKLNDGDETAKSDIDSRYLWTRLETQLSKTLGTSTTLSYIWSERDKEQFRPPNDEDVVGFLDYHQETEKVAARTDFSWTLGPQLIEFGGQLEYAQSDYDSSALIERGDLAILLGRAEIEQFDVHEHPDGWAGGVYLSGDFALGERLSVQPGLRWDVQDYYTDSGATDQFSPRIGVLYRFTDQLRARLDIGRFYQPDAIQEMQAADGVDRLFRPQRADHLIAALYWDPASTWDFRAEIYGKRYRHTTPRFENIFNPFVILPELEPDRVPIAPDRAESWGVDLEARHQVSDSLSAVLRYSYMDADDRINQTWIPRRWSQRHTVNAIATWERDSYVLSAALTWHTGWRTSTPPASVPSDAQLSVEQLLNQDELREYLSFDISASKSWQIGRSTLTAFADITNTLERNNLAGIDYDVEEVGNSFVFEPDQETVFPLIPSVGFVIAF